MSEKCPMHTVQSSEGFHACRFGTEAIKKQCACELTVNSPEEIDWQSVDKFMERNPFETLIIRLPEKAPEMSSQNYIDQIAKPITTALDNHPLKDSSGKDIGRVINYTFQTFHAPFYEASGSKWPRHASHPIYVITKNLALKAAAREDVERLRDFYTQQVEYELVGGNSFLAPDSEY